MDDITQSESVSEDTCEYVFERDGHRCWLCNHEGPHALHIAHQIDAAASQAFSRFQANGTIPSTVTNPSHPDNLFPLCPNCHVMYDATFPDWVLVPDPETLHKYIQHEKNDYEQRYLISQSPSNTIQPRSLPIIDRTQILYHPAIISHEPTTSINSRTLSQWPKGWLGEPTTVIHRVARRGLLESTPIQPLRLPGRGRGQWQMGVPAVFQVLIAELICLWARPPLVRVRGQKKNRGNGGSGV